MGRFFTAKTRQQEGGLGSNISPTRSLLNPSEFTDFVGLALLGKTKKQQRGSGGCGQSHNGLGCCRDQGKFHLAAIPTGSCPECFTSFTDAPQLKRKHFPQHLAFILLFPFLSSLFFGLPGPIPLCGLGKPKSSRTCLG